MASSLEFVEYVLDQMQEAGQMRTKKMFGKQKLSSLPNIGKVVEKQLCAVGIEDIETLKQIGSKEAWLRIQKIDDSACYNRLCALEGALQGIRWHDLSEEKKSELKSFYEAHH